MQMFIKNLMSKPVTIFRPDPLPPLTIPPYRPSAMVSVAGDNPDADILQQMGIEVFMTSLGPVKNLPPPEPGVILVVPAFVASRVRDRPDVFSPGRHVYGPGPLRPIIGCLGLRSMVHPLRSMWDFPPPQQGWPTPHTIDVVSQPSPVPPATRFSFTPGAIEVIQRVRKALKDDAAGDAPCSTSDLDLACEMLDDLILLNSLP
jgi:hypothetical protein